MTTGWTTRNGELLTHAMTQAERASARGDMEAAERWTRLAERQAGLLSRFLAEYRRAGIDVAALVGAPLTKVRRRR